MKKSLHTKEYKTFLALLHDVRTEKGFRQIDLAELLKVHQSFISKYESGERRLDILEVRQICRSIDIDFKDFINRLEELLHDC